MAIMDGVENGHREESENPISENESDIIRQGYRRDYDRMEEAPNPPLLRTNLLLHQKQGLHWMLAKEAEDNLGAKGGILADDMGLGKTVRII